MKNPENITLGSVHNSAESLQLKTSIAPKVSETLLDIASVCENVPAVKTLQDIAVNATLLIRLREVKELLATAVSQINRTLPGLEDTLCRQIAEQEGGDFSYKHPEATITPSAKGFFSIGDIEELTNSLIIANLGDAPLDKEAYIEFGERLPIVRKETQEQVWQLVKSKRALTEFCSDIQTRGLPLPKGIVSYIVASVRVRKIDNVG